MSLLGSGLSDAGQKEDSLSVQEADVSMKRRLGVPEEDILNAQSNLAITYDALGRIDEALSLRRDVYSRHAKHYGEEHVRTLIAVNNYAQSLVDLQRFKEAKSLLRKTIPVARRVLGESNHLTLSMRSVYALALYRDDAATLDDLREAVTAFEDSERIARRVLGGAHPLTVDIGGALREARAALSAREAQSGKA